MLGGRIVMSWLGWEQLTIRASSVDSVIDKLRTDLDSHGCEEFDFVDDIVIMVRSKVGSVVLERMQTGLNYTLKPKNKFKLDSGDSFHEE
jgi:hypothetical protein